MPWFIFYALHPADFQIKFEPGKIIVKGGVRPIYDRPNMDDSSNDGWYHVAIVWNPRRGYVSFYVDGIFVGRTEITVVRTIL